MTAALKKPPSWEVRPSVFWSSPSQLAAGLLDSKRGWLEVVYGWQVRLRPSAAACHSAPQAWHSGCAFHQTAPVLWYMQACIRRSIHEIHHYLLCRCRASACLSFCLFVMPTWLNLAGCHAARAVIHILFNLSMGYFWQRLPAATRTCHPGEYICVGIYPLGAD